MKVLAISGSPRPQGNTYLLLHETLKVLEQEGLETEYLSLHDKQILPCRACMQVRQGEEPLRPGRRLHAGL